ncbi:MAG: uncharacterized protein QG626_146 [Patescibacteria group bacterium]|jgi:uncharacterized protein YqgC (DUF456 family)|nr:uncharacterized protein [Patescibacteria group bacterium]
MTIDIIFTIATLFCVLLTCIPTLPGVPMLFGTIFIYALITNFSTLGLMPLIIFGSLALLSLFIDYSSGLIGAKLGGANKKSLLFGIIGLFIGMLIFPPFGAFLGLFMGVFVAELLQFHDHIKALRAASFSVITTALGAIGNVFIAVGMYTAFLILIF